MNRQVRWLLGEIAAWEKEGVITSDQARQLKTRYAVRQSGWDRLVFPAIGAIVIGLGVILFFAYNWAVMPKIAKLSIVFAGLLVTHGLGLYWQSRENFPQWVREGWHLLGTMLFGAGIWLIAQIYHIDEHYPNGYLLWGAGALAMAWALPSAAQGLLAVAILAVWSWSELIVFRHPMMAGWLLVLLALIPLAWWLRSRVLLFFSLLFFSLNYFSYVADFWDGGKNAIFIAFYLAMLYLALARLVQSSQFPESAPVFWWLGFPVYLLLLYSLSFSFGHRIIRHDGGVQSWQQIYYLLPLLLAALAWLWALVRESRKKPDWMAWVGVGLVLTTFILVIAADRGYLSGWILLIFNLIFLGHCILMIIQGIQIHSLRRVSAGCVLMAALLMHRFVDLFDSLLVRSMMFLLLGLIFLGIGILYAKFRPTETAHA